MNIMCERSLGYPDALGIIFTEISCSLRWELENLFYLKVEKIFFFAY